jgi:hypothetical protein
MLPKGKATHCYFYDAYTCSAATHAATRLSRYSYQLPQRALPPRAPSNNLSFCCLAHSRFVRPKPYADNCQNRSLASFRLYQPPCYPYACRYTPPAHPPVQTPSPSYKMSLPWLPPAPIGDIVVLILATPLA